VLDAANGAQSYGSDDCLNESRWIAAAALRATANQGEVLFDAYDSPIQAVTVDDLLAIADELEAQ